jgi:putative spermidine/putrescine transport system permease protein
VSGLRRRVARVIARRERLRLALELTAPTAWLLVVYIGALAALLITSLYSMQSDPTGLVTKLDTSITWHNFRQLFDVPVYREVLWRTVRAAATVTAIDMLVAVPVAFYMAKIASRWARRGLVVAVTMPLWAGYLVKGYAWRSLLDPGGGALKEVFGHTPGFTYASSTLVLAYLWFPYMVIPIYAGLERLPDSLLEASTDLGAKAGRTFRSVILPQLRPALIAGSVFTFSLTLGDFYMNNIVGGTTEFLGNIVYRQFSANLPFAAAYSVLPVLIMIVYILGARRAGALEEL